MIKRTASRHLYNRIVLLHSIGAPAFQIWPLYSYDWAVMNMDLPNNFTSLELVIYDTTDVQVCEAMSLLRCSTAKS